jgi:hypothetical protein
MGSVSGARGMRANDPKSFGECARDYHGTQLALPFSLVYYWYAGKPDALFAQTLQFRKGQAVVISDLFIQAFGSN